LTASERGHTAGERNVDLFAIAAWSSCFMSGIALGPVLGGLLLDALLRLIGRRHGDAEPLAQGSDGQREFVERDRHPLVHWLLAREVVVPTSQVLHEAMPNDDHPGATVLLEPAHRPQPRLEAAVVALDRLLV
jgi:hypothetical protein